MPSDIFMAGDTTISFHAGGTATRRFNLMFGALATAAVFGAAAVAVALASKANFPGPWNAATVGGHHAAAATMQANAAQTNASLRPTTQIISSDALPHVQGKRVTSVVVEFPPSGFSPPHHHGGSVTVYVLAGSIRSQLAGQPPAVYRPGETFFEPPGIAHLVAENVSATEPARILAVFVAEEGAALTTYHE